MSETATVRLAPVLSVTRLLENAGGRPVNTNLTLPFERRQKSRQRARLDSGEEIGLFLPRGTVLRGGDLLEEDGGMIIEVKAAAEPLSVAEIDDPLLLAKACYHLGNRHVPVQIERNRVFYLHDHVLDDMLRKMGVRVSVETAPFEPETGAYFNHAHSH